MGEVISRTRKYLIFGLNDLNSADQLINAIESGGGVGSAVDSVFTRTGNVIAMVGDYSAAMVTNAVDQTAAYGNPSWITSLAGSKVIGDIVGDAASINGTITESQVVGLVTDLANKAPLASPPLTGVPTAPTATIGTNTTQLATTAFVLANAVIGGGDKNFVYNQATSSALWNIVHNLGKYPAIFVVDSAGSVVVGDIKYIDLNTATVTFASGFTGQAYLN